MPIAVTDYTCQLVKVVVSVPLVLLALKDRRQGVRHAEERCRPNQLVRVFIPCRGCIHNPNCNVKYELILDATH